ncbi:MAG: thioredoxin [Nitrospirae bacterium RBG_13_43_8]|nr:MAG: thioredoxin [Nitrospirae bacterium RBG_13_43_8]
MTDKSILLRCIHCRTINRVATGRLTDNPKCGKCKTFLEFPDRPVDVTAANFDQEILVWPGVVLVEFWASWCGACRMISPAIDELARERPGLLKVAKINVDYESSLGARFGIKATPTFLLYQNGRKLNEIAGALPKTDLERWIDSSIRN